VTRLRITAALAFEDRWNSAVSHTSPTPLRAVATHTTVTGLAPAKQLDDNLIHRRSQTNNT
jgi:hypothetical protein